MNTPTQINRTQAPLEKLFLSQLEAILQCEMRLAERQKTLEKAANSDQWQEWAAEVMRLRSRTDRLAEFLEVLDENGAGLTRMAA